MGLPVVDVQECETDRLACLVPALEYAVTEIVEMTGLGIEGHLEKTTLFVEPDRKLSHCIGYGRIGP